MSDLTKEGLAWALAAAADACDGLRDAGLSLRALGTVMPPTMEPGALGHELRVLACRIAASDGCLLQVETRAGLQDYEVDLPPQDVPAKQAVPSAPRHARTFDPVLVAVGQVGSREEALKLLGEIAPHYNQCNERVRGFLRGMRDQMMDEAWRPSEKQLTWLRSLAAGGWHERRR